MSEKADGNEVMDFINGMEYIYRKGRPGCGKAEWMLGVMKYLLVEMSLLGTKEARAEIVEETCRYLREGMAEVEKGVYAEGRQAK